MLNFTRRFGRIAFSLFVLFSLSASSIYAQTTSISGSVNEEGTKETLVGVNILVKGKVIGTVTDLKGNFNLRVNQAPPLTLVFSMVGYGTKEIEITQNNVSNLQVTLAEQTLLGQEIVVSASRIEESILI